MRKKMVGTSIIDNSRKKPAGKHVCFSTSPRRKPKPLSLSPSKRLSQSAKQQRTSPKKKSTVHLSPLKSGGEGGRTVRERAGSYSNGIVRFNLVIVYMHMQGCIQRQVWGGAIPHPPHHTLEIHIQCCLDMYVSGPSYMCICLCVFMQAYLTMMY